MNVKRYLKKNGIKIGAIVLVIALIAGLSSYLLKGKAGLVQNMTGAVKAPVQRIVSSMAEWLEGLYGYIYEYDQRQAENERLREALTEAQEEARNGKSAVEENARLRKLLDFKEKHSDMTLEPAKVISWTSSNWSSSFNISKGTSSDIAVGDSVITEYGVLVGQVVEVGTGWATVRTVIDINTNIGAFVSENGSAGMMVGDFALMQEGSAKMTYLADGAQIFTGDTVMTSGAGGAFPQGLVIGTISSVQTEAGGQVEYGIIKPGCDLNALVQVYVVKEFEVVE